MKNGTPSMTAMVSSAAAAARAVAGGRLETRGAVVLAYHDIGDDPAENTTYSLTPELFREHLLNSLRWGLRFVPLGELTQRMRRGDGVAGMAAITFDDGLVGVHHHAMPILLDLGLPATVFAVTESLGATPSWWPGSARMMSCKELKEMAAAGFEVSSHSRTHASLPFLEDRDLKEELVGSQAELEQLTGRAVDIIAYPYGHFDARVLDAVADAGYRAGYSFLNGRLVAGLDRLRLPRLCMGPWQGRLRLALDLARRPAAWPDSQRQAHRG